MRHKHHLFDSSLQWWVSLFAVKKRFVPITLSDRVTRCKVPVQPTAFHPEPMHIIAAMMLKRHHTSHIASTKVVGNAG